MPPMTRLVLRARADQTSEEAVNDAVEMLSVFAGRHLFKVGETDYAPSFSVVGWEEAEGPCRIEWTRWHPNALSWIDVHGGGPEDRESLKEGLAQLLEFQTWAELSQAHAAEPGDLDRLRRLCLSAGEEHPMEVERALRAALASPSPAARHAAGELCVLLKPAAMAPALEAAAQAEADPDLAAALRYAAERLAASG